MYVPQILMVKVKFGPVYIVTVLSEISFEVFFYISVPRSSSAPSFRISSR